MLSRVDYCFCKRTAIISPKGTPRKRMIAPDVLFRENGGYTGRVFSGIFTSYPPIRDGFILIRNKVDYW